MAEFRRLGGLKLTAQFLQLAKTWPVLKAVTGLVRNLVNDEAKHDTLVARKAIPRLASILAMAVKEEQKVKGVRIALYLFSFVFQPSSLIYNHQNYNNSSLV